MLGQEEAPERCEVLRGGGGVEAAPPPSALLLGGTEITPFMHERHADPLDRLEAGRAALSVLQLGH